MKTQVDNAKTNKHINKINDLLSESFTVDAQTWKTSVRWPDQSVLENDSDWDNDEEGEEYEEQDEEKEEDEDEEEEEEEDEEGEGEGEEAEEEDL